MNRTSLVICLAASMVATVGCASKNYVKQQTTPLINKTNELDDLTAKNTRDIKDVDARAQAGIQAVNAKTAEVEQKTQSRWPERQPGAADGRRRQRPRGCADQHRRQPRQLSRRCRDLGEVRIQQDNLTPEGEGSARSAREPASPRTKGYIIALEGGTDSVGPADYNYDLSQRRANSVIQYLATKYNVPAHKIYVIGLGKDKPVETNKTSAGRADNRRVDVRLMTNTVGGSDQPADAGRGQNNPSSM